MEKRPAWLRNGILMLASLFILALSLPAAVCAAPGGEPGKPGGWPEGEGPPEGKGPRTGGGDTRMGDLFGDPMVVVRDLSPQADGKPLYFKWTWPEELYTPDGELVIPLGALPEGYVVAENQNDPTACVQPISFEPLSYVGEQFTYEEYLDSYGEYPDPVYLIPLDDECKIPEVYEGIWEAVEIESGRLNLARTTQSVLDSAYAEAIANINTAESIGLDPAGRLLLTIPGEEEGTTELKTIDSPRENLALYQKLMNESCLSGINSEVYVPEELNHLLVCDLNESEEPVPSQADLLSAASFFAGAADKFSHVGIDEVIYINTILGINQVVQQTDGTWLITGYKDVGDFIYTRSNVHYGKEATLLQPAENIEGETNFTITEGVDIYGSIFMGDWGYIFDQLDPEKLPAYPVMNFARATDDAVSIIYYIHNYEPPVVPVPMVP